MIYKSIKERDPNKRWTHNISGKVLVFNDPPYRQIFIDSVIIADYLIGSKFEEASAIVILAKNESVSIPNLADAFGIHHKTIYTYVSSYKANGLEGLRPAAHYPGKVNNTIIDFICNEQNNSPSLTLTMLNRKLYQTYKLTLAEKTIRNLVESQTIKPLCKEPDGQITMDEILNNPSIKEEEPSSPIEKHGEYTRYAGYLIFTSMISDLFSDIYKYIDDKTPIKSRFKTWEAKKLITAFVLYFFMGFTNIEQTKTVNRQELGCLLGEDIAPCARTLKRNMHDLMSMNLPEVIPDILTQEYIAKGYVEVGQLYYDGHFVPYYGKEDIGSGFFTQRRLAVPGHEQYWANDVKGRPVFFLSNYGFSRFPQAIIELSERAKGYMKKAGDTKPLLIAFDRGGYSSALFLELNQMGVCWATWKSGETKDRDKDDFKETFVLETQGNKNEYGILYTKHKMVNSKEPFDAAVILNKKTEKQITILYGIPDEAKEFYQPLDAVKFLLNRWKQENFFKYALKEVDINQTHGLELGTEEDAYYVPNPEYNALLVKQVQLDKKRDTLESRKEKVEEKYFTLKRKPLWEKYLSQKSYQKLLYSLDEITCECQSIADSIMKTPYLIPYTKKDGSLYAYLDFSKVNLMNALKGAVYNMRWHMKDIAKEYFKDYREISKFITVLTQTGGYYLKEEYHDSIYLNPLETPAYQAAAEKLIKKLNQMSPKSLGENSKPLEIKFKY